MSLMADQTIFVWIKGGNFTLKSWLKDNDIKMHPEHNEVKFAVAERFTRTLNTIIYK